MRHRGLLMDMSGSMGHGGQYINVKRMALALDGLIRKEYPGDFLQFIEMASFAKPVHAERDRRGDAQAGDDLSTRSGPPAGGHVASGRSARATSRRTSRTSSTRCSSAGSSSRPATRRTGRWSSSRTACRPPTSRARHLYLLYPSDRRTEQATMRRRLLCQREGIVINIFLLSSWSQSEEDIRFAHRLAETTKGRVFFTAGRDLDRFVVWDYVNRRKSIIS